MSTRDVDKDGLTVTALLIDTIDWKTEFKAFLTKSRLGDKLPKKTIGLTYMGGGLPDAKVTRHVQSNASAKLITFGYTDLKNPGGGYDGKDYTRREEAMNAGEYYDYTIYLQPTSYTFAPGHKAVLVLTAYDPYITQSPEALVKYSFNIDNDSLEFRFPKEKTAR